MILDEELIRSKTRLKRIQLTKLQQSYKKYERAVPKSLRIKQLSENWHPNTPDHLSYISNSQWNRKISQWRKQVHLWNNIQESKLELLIEATNRGDPEAFLKIAEKVEEGANNPLEIYKNLLSLPPKSCNLTPVLYKPQWFNGNITHKGFTTLNEVDFITHSKEIIKAIPNPEKEFYIKYISSFTNI